MGNAERFWRDKYDDMLDTIDSCKGLVAAEKTSKNTGMSADLYYLYTHVLKWGWTIVETTKEKKDIVFRIRSPRTGKSKTIILFSRK